MRVYFLFLPAAGTLGLVVAGCGLETGGLLGSEDTSGDSGGVPVVDAALAADSTSAQADASDGSLFLGRDGATGADEDGDAAITAPGDDAANDAGSWGDDAGDANLVAVDAGIDAQCTGSSWTCTPGAIPSGWRLVEYVESNRPACSNGYGSAIDVVEGPSAPDAKCTCACNVTTPGSCESADYTVSYNAAGATTCAGGSASVAPNGGACTAVTSFTLAAGSKLQIDPAPFTAGSCTPAPTQTLPPVQYAGEGEICNATSTSSAACANGGVCAPAAKGSFDLCIVASGAQACPAGFPNAHQVSTGVTDSRACTACTCGTDTASCTNALHSIFTEAGCGSGGISIPANDMCNDVPLPMSAGSDGGTPFVAIEYTAQVQNEMCPPSSVTPTGSVVLASVHTVCCE